MKTEELRKRFETTLFAKNEQILMQYEDLKENLLQFLQSEVEAAEKAKEEQIEKDYIAWVFHNSYGDSRPYKGETPFAEWKTKAEAQDMSDWK